MQHIPKEILEKNIIEILDIGSLPEERQVALVEKILTLAQQRITLRMLEGFDQKQQADFLEAVSKKDEEKVANLVAGANIDVIALIVEEVFKIKKELLAHAQKITSN